MNHKTEHHINTQNNARQADEETARDAEANRRLIQSLQEQEEKVTSAADSLASPPGKISPGKEDRLEARALRRRWNVPARKRLEIIGRQIAIATHAEKDSQAISAFRALLEAERQDDRRVSPQPAKSKQVTVSVNVAAKEAAVFGDLASFQAAAEHATRKQLADLTAAPTAVTEDTSDAKPNQ